MGSRAEYTIRDEQSWARPITRFLLGCVIAGACLAAIEVLWTVLSPQLPIETLKRQALLPPPSIVRFVRSALMVDVGAASAIGLVLALPSLFLSKRKPDWALPAGLLFAGTLLVSIFAVVWASLLSPGALFDPSTVLSMGLTALPLLLWIAVLVAVVRTGRTALNGAMRALALGAVVPLVAASLLHVSIPFPNRIERGQPDADLPNLILVTLDTLRADHLAPWTEGSARTPTLSRLAREGVLFERAMSPVPHTTPSHVSMFTSVYPFAHGARNGIPMRTNLATLPTELRKQGYSTAAIVSAYTTKSNVTGMGHAFDTYIDSLHPELEWIARDDIEPLVAARLIDRFGGNQIAAPVINRRLEGWLERVDGDDLPFFLWLHYFDAHEPYTPTPEYADLYPPADDSIQAKKIARYRAEITYLDDQLGKALDQLSEAGYLDDAVVVVTSDHGEAFGEPHPHIDTSHGAHLYDSVMWVPLIIWGPARIASNRRIPEQVELLDIAPTLMDLIGVTPPAGFAGRSLSSALTAEPPSIEPSRAFAQTRTLSRPRRLALRTNEWKLVLNPDDEEKELFDLRADPGETTDVSNDYPDVVRGFREEIEFISRGDVGDEPRVEDLDPAAIEHLKALGYIDE